MEDVLSAARESWPPDLAPQTGALVFSNVESLDGTPIAVSASEEPEAVPAAVWHYNDGWAPTAHITGFSDFGFSMVDQVELADLTGDGNPEILISHVVMRRAGTVFSLVDGEWAPIFNRDGLQLVDGRLIGEDRHCVPDCATGGTVNYEYLWNGTDFVSVETVPPRTTVPGDLAVAGLDMSRPECDGRYITVVGSAVTPGRYVENVGSSLASHPGSDYLRTDQTCPSLRSHFNGDPIYVTYFGPFTDVAEACLNRSRGPVDAYVRQLSDFTSADHVINCS